MLKTVNYSLSPTYKYQNGHEPALTGYSAANIVQVTLDDLTKISNVIDAAAQAGANNVRGIAFTLRDQDAVHADALRKAAAKARADAEVLAAALGLKIVRVLTRRGNRRTLRAGDAHHVGGAHRGGGRGGHTGRIRHARHLGESCADGGGCAALGARAGRLLAPVRRPEQHHDAEDLQAPEQHRRGADPGLQRAEGMKVVHRRRVRQSRARCC